MFFRQISIRLVRLALNRIRKSSQIEPWVGFFSTLAHDHPYLLCLSFTLILMTQTILLKQLIYLEM